MKTLLILGLLFLAGCDDDGSNSAEFIDSESFDGYKVENYYVSNPSSDAELYVSIYMPEISDGRTILLVPGGLRTKDDFIESGMVKEFVNNGFVTVIFDPQGRGLSSGKEDHNGFVGQDGLKEIYNLVLSVDEVSKDNVGIASFSYGVALASGFLGSYKDHLKYYIEWEGPVDRYYVTLGCPQEIEIAVVPSGTSCESDEYWSEREAVKFIPDFNIDYFLIMQSSNDHIQPDWNHSLDAYNVALASLDWVRVNDGGINEKYSYDEFPVGRLTKLKAVEYAIELAGM